jgi:hypothetical protein
VIKSRYGCITQGTGSWYVLNEVEASIAYTLSEQSATSVPRIPQHLRGDSVVSKARKDALEAPQPQFESKFARQPPTYTHGRRQASTGCEPGNQPLHPTTAIRAHSDLATGPNTSNALPDVRNTPSVMDRSRRQYTQYQLSSVDQFLAHMLFLADTEADSIIPELDVKLAMFKSPLFGCVAFVGSKWTLNKRQQQRPILIPYCDVLSISSLRRPICCVARPLHRHCRSGSKRCKVVLSCSPSATFPGSSQPPYCANPSRNGSRHSRG